jgi:hypothetical protein
MLERPGLSRRIDKYFRMTKSVAKASNCYI